MSLCCILWIGSFWISVWSYSQMFLVTKSLKNKTKKTVVAILVKIFQNKSCFGGLLGRHFDSLKKHPIQTCMLDNVSPVWGGIFRGVFHRYPGLNWPETSTHKVLYLTQKSSLWFLLLFTMLPRLQESSINEVFKTWFHFKLSYCTIHPFTKRSWCIHVKVSEAQMFPSTVLNCSS